MNLTRQFLEDHRELERKLDELAQENARLRHELERMREETRGVVIKEVEQLRAEHDRLRETSAQLRGDRDLWRRRYDDLVGQ